MSNKMNLPNKLTVLRLCLVPVIVIFLLLPINPYICYGVGAVIFIFTAVTDMLDGSIAVSNDIAAEPAVSAATVQWLGNLK